MAQSQEGNCQDQSSSGFTIDINWFHVPSLEDPPPFTFVMYIVAQAR